MNTPTVALPQHVAESGFDVHRIRRDFPILSRQINGKPLIYADNAATTQKPAVVIERLRRYYEYENANIHRGVHSLSEDATEAYEAARTTVQRFLNAQDEKEIVFTRGTTEAINLVAQTYARSTLVQGDEILISELEHHSNIVPWQILCEQMGTQLKVASITDEGEIDLDQFDELLSTRTKIVAIGHISNALGTINPVEEIIQRAHAAGAVVLIDGAQASIHARLDVQAMGCDFYAFSGHKALGPTGIGILFGRAELLDAMPPYQGGGDMIKVVSFAGTQYNDIPYKFEAGTPHIAGGLGLAAALDYFSALDLNGILEHEHELLRIATERALGTPGLRIIGRAAKKAAVVSFTIDGIHPHDLGTLLDHQGVAIRTGHHCAMPVMERYNIAGTARASFALYNTIGEVHALFDAIDKARPMLLG